MLGFDSLPQLESLGRLLRRSRHGLCKVLTIIRHSWCREEGSATELAGDWRRRKVRTQDVRSRVRITSTHCSLSQSHAYNDPRE